MAQFIHLTSWQQFLQKTSQKNAPPLHSCKFFFTFPFDSNHPNHTHPTAPGSLRRLRSCDCHLSSHHPFPSRLPCQQQPNQPGTLPTLKSHRTYGAVAKRLKFFVWKKMVSEGSILSDLKRQNLQNKKSTFCFGSVSKKIKMSINETNTI